MNLPEFTYYGSERDKLLRKRRIALIPYEALEFQDILDGRNIELGIADAQPPTLESVTLYYTASNADHEESFAALEHFREKGHAEAIEYNGLHDITTSSETEEEERIWR